MNIDMLPDRLAKKVAPDENECWLWTAFRDPDGYGRAYHNQKSGRLAHRVVYETLLGEVPEGLELDHLCFNGACVNPDHLEPVPHLANMRRRVPRVAEPRDRCVHGHEYTEANTYWLGDSPRCRTCRHDAVRRYRSRRAVSA